MKEMKKDGQEKLEARIAELEQKLEETNSKYLRALADYQNLERQTVGWKEEFTKYANMGLIRKQLEVLDDLEKALKHLQDEGLKLIIGKLKNILSEEGLEEIDILGKEFDPNLAEVVSTKPGDKDNIIVEILQKGYRIGEKVVRPAKVVVLINNQETRDNNQSNNQNSIL